MRAAALIGAFGCACLIGSLASPAMAQTAINNAANAVELRQDKGQEQSGQPGQDKVLRVCQDPNNLPFSNRAQAGFENKIAALFAQQLGWKLETVWFPQRIGFIRNTLRAKEENVDHYKCDLVTGVPIGFEMAATTHAYYHSSYSLVYVKGRGKGLDGVRDLNGLLALPPAQRAKLRFGVFTGSPLIDWMLEHDLLKQVEWYQVQSGDADQYPGQVIERDLAGGKIDVAFVWGPIAGYFARNTRSAPIVAVQLKSGPGIKLDFDIAMAVRHSDKDFKQRIDKLIDSNQGKIDAILTDYGVPLLERSPQAPASASVGAPR
jgi:mxaJ protein